MARDLYVVLGISRDADLQQVKRAYRRLVKQLHPDRRQDSRRAADAERFMQVREAYEVLSDPAARAEHDRVLAQLDREQAAAREPLPPRRGPHPVTDRSRWSALDHWLDGWLPGIPARARPPAQHKDLYVEIWLSPPEAASGGVLDLDVPFERVCPHCAGLGCAACDAFGWRAEHHALELRLPPGVADGTRQRLPLTGLGLPGVDLIVELRVG